jgi:lipoate-protein ligase A
LRRNVDGDLLRRITGGLALLMHGGPICLSHKCRPNTKQRESGVDTESIKHRHIVLYLGWAERAPNRVD